MDLYAHEFGQFLARGGTDHLDPAAALAKDNGALAVAFDQYLLIDFDAAIGAFDIFFGLDRAGIRQFIVQLQIELLARDFSMRPDARLRPKPDPRGNAKRLPASRRQSQLSGREDHRPLLR